MKRKIISLLLAAVVSASTLAACGTSPAASPSAAGAKEGSAGTGEDLSASGSTAAAEAGTTAGEAGTTAAAEAGNTSAAETGATAAAEAGTTAAAPADLVTTGGKPWIDSDLKANITENMSLSPAEDFHLYVNHDWLLQTELPAGYRSYNAFAEVQDEVEKKAREVLEDETLTGHDAELVQSLYGAILDWDSRDAAGMDPILGIVQDIQGINNLEALSDFICDPERSFFAPVFINVNNMTDLADSSHYITQIWNDGFTLDDAAEYKNRTEMGERAFNAGLYEAKALLPRLGYTEEEAAEMFDTLIGLESRLAEVSLTSADTMQADYIDRINNIYTPQELADLSPVFPLVREIASRGYDAAEKYIVPEPEVVKRMNELYTEENLEAMKTYMLVRLVFESAPALDSSAYDAYVEAANMKSGSTGRLDDRKVAYDIVRNALSTPMDRAYLERYDAQEQKEQITQICRDVIDTYRTMLSEEDWLSEETKAKAIEKLDNIRINAVYPDKWIDYSTLHLTGLSFFDCMREIDLFQENLDRSHTNGTVDKDIWEFDILETNAYYNPQENSINLILGILDAPFYYEGISREELLGGIGIVIGHEISHAFDTNGAQYDKDGNYANWWTEEDYTAFKERASRLASYYDSITVWEGQNAIGTNVQTEAIADMAGMKAMLRIAKEEEDFDYKAFFTAFATIWRRINTRETEYSSVTQDPHPLHYLRTNVAVQQFEEFREAFDVKEGDTMYLAPEDTVLVW